MGGGPNWWKQNFFKTNEDMWLEYCRALEFDKPPMDFITEADFDEQELVLPDEPVLTREESDSDEAEQPSHKKQKKDLQYWSKFNP